MHRCRTLLLPLFLAFFGHCNILAEIFPSRSPAYSLISSIIPYVLLYHEQKDSVPRLPRTECISRSRRQIEITTAHIKLIRDLFRDESCIVENRKRTFYWKIDIKVINARYDRYGSLQLKTVFKYLSEQYRLPFHVLYLYIYLQFGIIKIDVSIFSYKERRLFQKRKKNLNLSEERRGSFFTTKHVICETIKGAEEKGCRNFQVKCITG